jgi:uncharacterized protein YjbJ (UPF0337 family)
MAGTTDDLKGRAKEAAGDLTDDQKLKDEGKVDRVVGKAKDMAHRAGEAVKDAVNPDRSR